MVGPVLRWTPRNHAIGINPVSLALANVKQTDCALIICHLNHCIRLHIMDTNGLGCADSIVKCPNLLIRVSPPAKRCENAALEIQQPPDGKKTDCSNNAVRDTQIPKSD